MRRANGPLILPQGSTTSLPFTSVAIYVGTINDYSIQITYLTSSATVKLQCSSDPGTPTDQSYTSEKVVNWTDITDSITSLTENGDLMYDVTGAGYCWIRLVITGSGFLTSANFNIKGG